jgi:hypothetical protein
MKLLVLALALALAGTAFAGGFSLGFKEVNLPVYVQTGTDATMGDVPLLRLGSALTPDFRIEALLGYAKSSYDEEDGPEGSLSTFAIGGSGFYVIAAPSNTVFSIGGTLLYAKTSGEDDGAELPSTSDLTILPVMRIDFAFPQVNQVAFFTEFGLRYDKATTTVDTGTVEVDYSYSHLGTYNSPHILGGMYYSF